MTMNKGTSNECGKGVSGDLCSEGRNIKGRRCQPEFLRRLFQVGFEYQLLYIILHAKPDKADMFEIADIRGYLDTIISMGLIGHLRMYRLLSCVLARNHLLCSYVCCYNYGEYRGEYLYES